MSRDILCDLQVFANRKRADKNTGPAHAEIIFRRFDLKVYLTAVLFSICARRIHDTHWLNPSPMDPRQPHQPPSLISLSQGKFNWLELRRFLAHLPAHLQILRPLAICLLLLNSCIYIYIYLYVTYIYYTVILISFYVFI